MLTTVTPRNFNCYWYSWSKEKKKKGKCFKTVQNDLTALSNFYIIGLKMESFQPKSQWKSLGVFIFVRRFCKVKVKCVIRKKKNGLGILSLWWCQISIFAKSPVLISLCVSWLGIRISIVYIIAGLCILNKHKSEYVSVMAHRMHILYWFYLNFF